MRNNYTVIGKSKPKIDVRIKVTGQAKYAADLKFPNMLYGKILTSPYAHARILSIDTSDAKKLPGVKAVITHQDVPNVKYGISPARFDENIFCIDKVRYVGDKIAAVAAVDEETVYKALKLIKVEYEELPTVFDPIEAMQEGAPLIHDDYPRNMNVEVHQHFGDVDKALAEAYHVRTDQFVGQRTTHAALEPHTTTCIWEDGKLTLHASTQAPFHTQYFLSRVFGLKMGDVRVIKPFVGGGFGAKNEPGGLEFAGSALAMITGRPVKMWYDRYDVFTHNRGRHRVIMKLTTGVDKNGKILGVHADFIMDGGAYTGIGIATAYYAGSLLPLTYDFENFKYDMYRPYTNLPPCGAQRGHGAPQPRYAFESHLDMIAEDLGIDPLELRLRNARKPDTVTPNELKINSCELKACIETARDISGWEEKKGKLPKGRGIGIAVGSFLSGSGHGVVKSSMPHAAAVIKVNEDGTAATLYTGACEIGQGSDTILCQMAAEAMGYNFENMKVVGTDTEITPHDFGAWGSRQTLMTGSAVKQAGEEIKTQILEMASEILQTDVTDLDCREGKIFSLTNQELAGTFEEIAKEFFYKKGPLVGRGSYTPPKLGGKFKGATIGTSPAYSFGALISEVEIDEETGEINVKEVWDVHDCGQVINPELVHAQVHGALYMGMGESIWEEVVFDEKGRIKNANLSEYRLPTALDMPKINSEVVDSYEPNGPWGVKEIGEGSTCPTIGSFSNAIYDAMGVRVYSLPLSYEKVWRAMKEKREKEELENNKKI